MKSIYNRFKNRYVLLSVPVKAALWYTVCSIVQKALAFLVTPLFTRIMPKEDFAIYTVYNSWYWIVTAIVTLNLYNGIFNNGMQEYKFERDRYTSILQSLGTIVTVFFYFIYLLFRKKVEEITGLNTLLCSLMFLQAIFTPALYYWQGRQRYEYKYHKMIVVTILIAFIRPFISAVAVVLSHNKGVARVISFATFEICIGLLFYIFNIVKGRKLFDLTIWKSALIFAIPLVPHYLSQTFLTNLDKLMIDRFCGKEPVAVYEIAYTVAMITTFINTSINGSFVPWFYDHLERRDVEDIPRVSNGMFIAVGGINLFVVLFAKEIVMILGGNSYSEAISIIPVLCWSVFFIFIYTMFGDIEFYYKKTQFTMYASLISALLNAILNYIFIQQYGYKAAAYTTLACYIILALLHYYFAKKIQKKEKIKNIFDYRFVFVLGFFGTIVSVLAILLYNNDIIRWTIIICALILTLFFRKKIIANLAIIVRKKNTEPSE